MALRVITARLNGLPSDGPVLNGALSLAASFGGHIDALFSRPDPRLSVAAIDEGVYPGFYDEMVSVMERQWTEVANKALKHFEAWRTTNHVHLQTDPDQPTGPSAEWRDSIGSETEVIGRLGRVSDIIVAALPSRRMESSYDLGFEAALLETGRPVLLIPPNSHVDPTAGNVVIAWNGSVEASRAVSAAMPILTKAREVTVFTASEGGVDAAMAEELVTYLKWHGVRASILEPKTGISNSVEDALLAAVKKTKANLLVMGAYTHSRLKEMLFGGVTRQVFRHATVPVLMAH